MPMLLVDIPDLLISKGIVTNTTAANATLIYAIKWMEGIPIDFAKSAPNVHRARLRKIGLDIKKPFSGEIYSAEQSRQMVATRIRPSGR